MHIALECPTKLLVDIQSLADFDWLLTHLVLEDEDYRNFYKDSKRLKILDNSVNELGEPCSLKELLKAAELVSPHFVCPPDWLGDYEKTRWELDSAITKLDTEQILPIVQGKNTTECLAFSEYVLKLGLDRIAVPFDITYGKTDPLGVLAKARSEVVDELSNLELGDQFFRWIHLLGLTALEELDFYKDNEMHEVSSIDTGSPYLNGAFARRFGRDELFDKTVKIDYGVNPGNRLQDVYYNIAYLRKLTGKDQTELLRWVYG